MPIKKSSPVHRTKYTSWNDDIAEHNTFSSDPALALFLFIYLVAAYYWLNRDDGQGLSSFGFCQLNRVQM